MDSVELIEQTEALAFAREEARHDRNIRGVSLVLGAAPVIGLMVRLLQSTQGYKTGLNQAVAIPPSSQPIPPGPPTSYIPPVTTPPSPPIVIPDPGTPGGVIVTHPPPVDISQAIPRFPADSDLRQRQLLGPFDISQASGILISLLNKGWTGNTYFEYPPGSGNNYVIVGIPPPPPGGTTTGRPPITDRRGGRG